MSPRTFHVIPSEKGQTLAAVLKRRLRLSWTEARQLINERRVRLAGNACGDFACRVQTGQRVEITFGNARPPSGPGSAKRKRRPPPQAKPALLCPTIVYFDDHLVVVDKPPALTTMRHADEAAEFGERGKRFLPPTLADLLPRLLGDRKPVRAVHRLDRDTSGLVVFARTVAAERELGQQFRAHSIARRYLAIVRGRPRPGRVESFLVRDRGDGRRGSGPASEQAQRAITHIRIVEELGEFTLVECRLETGRTHQVRIHLGEQGAPVCGERIYDRPLHGAPVADTSGARRLALHAAMLGLRHPNSGVWREWEAPMPADMANLLARLGQAGK